MKEKLEGVYHKESHSSVLDLEFSLPGLLKIKGKRDQSLSKPGSCFSPSCELEHNLNWFPALKPLCCANIYENKIKKVKGEKHCENNVWNNEYFFW